MKRFKISIIPMAIVFLSAILLAGCTVYTTPTTTVYSYSSNNPTWAPSYYSGARYYYLPDIECYYDLSSRDFILLNNGRWIYTASIVPYYPSYDLFTSYVVIINTNVYQPWMHHQYYNSHYPRYYYIDYYDYSNIPYVRGFNENQKRAIFWEENQRNKARPWNDNNIKNNRNFTYSNADRRVQQETTERLNNNRAATSTTSRNDRTSTDSRNNTSSSTRSNTATNTTTRSTTTTTTTTSRNSTTTSATTRTSSSGTMPQGTTSTTTTNRSQSNNSSTRSSQVNYYGSPIGQPVRVEKQMKETTTTRSSSNESRTTNRSSSSNNTTRKSSDSSSTDRNSTGNSSGTNRR